MFPTKAKKVASPLLLWLLVLLAIKLLGLVIDCRPQFYQGDSTTYLSTAIWGYIPPERSFTYGFLIRPLGVWTHTLHLLVFFQSMLTGLSAWMVAVILIRYFNASFRLAAAMSLLCALEPFQLLYERYVMTEAVSVFLFSILLLAVFQYLRTQRLGWLCLVQALGVFLISFRISYLPLVTLASFALPFLTRPAFDLMTVIWRRKHLDWRALAYPILAHAFVALILSQTLLYGYHCLNGTLSHYPPAYLYEDGIFMLAEVSPILKEEDFPIAEDRESIFGHPAILLSDRHKRSAQRWDRNGVCQVLRQRYGELEGNALARATAFHAVERDPLGGLKLVALTYSDFFESHRVRNALIGDENYSPLRPEEMQLAWDHFGEDFHFPNSSKDAFTKTYHHSSTIWVQFLVIMPLAFGLYLICRESRATAYHWICFTCACSFLATATITVEDLYPRYLTSMAWIAFVIIGAVLSDLTRRSPST